MTKVSFYILKSNDVLSRLNAASLLIQKAYQKDHHVFVYFDDVGFMKQLDECLWAVSPESFIPHEIATDDEPDDLAKIHLSMQVPSIATKDVLINLSNSLPIFAADFLRVIEILNQDEATLSSGRKRFSVYKTKGFELETHHI